MKKAGYILNHKLGNGCDGSAICENKAQDHIYVLSSYLEENKYWRYIFSWNKTVPIKYIHIDSKRCYKVI